MKIFIFLFLISTQFVLAGNLSTLIKGSSQGAVGGLDTNLTAGSYFDVGGDPFFCKKKTISNEGEVIRSDINQGRSCSVGKICIEGNCTDGSSMDHCNNAATPYGFYCSSKTFFIGQIGNRSYKTTPSNCGLDVNAPNCSGIGIDSQFKTQADALSFCENLVWDGFDDWTLATKTEFALLANNLYNPLTNIANTWYWVKPMSGDNATIVSKYDNVTSWGSPSATYGYRCVRYDEF